MSEYATMWTTVAGESRTFILVNEGDSFGGVVTNVIWADGVDTTHNGRLAGDVLSDLSETLGSSLTMRVIGGCKRREAGDGQG